MYFMSESNQMTEISKSYVVRELQKGGREYVKHVIC